MTQITGVNPQYYQPQVGPVAAPQTSYAPQQMGYQADQAQFRYQQGPPNQAPKQESFKLLDSGDLKMGIAGAVGGFFLAGLIGLSGPIGALILGVALLAVSMGSRAMKHNKQKKAQAQTQQPQYQQPRPVQFSQQQSGQSYQYNYQYQQQPMQSQPYQYSQAAPQQNMNSQQNYQQGQQGYAGGNNTWGSNMWEKFLSWL